MTITLNLKILKELSLSPNEYVWLFYLYSNQINESINIIVDVDTNRLQDLKYIKITDTGYVLRSKGRALFEDDEDKYFYSFVALFPIKTPSGRYLSPNPNTESKKLNDLKAKWKKIFKNNNIAKEKAIKVLSAEIDYRKKMRTQEYMHNADTWLNQADYENYEYLLDENLDDSTNTNNPFSEII